MSDWIDHSIDAEQSILGGLLFNNAAFPVVEKIIKPEHFFEPIHKSTYEVISQLISAGKLCNAVTIRSFLPANLSLGELNLGQYIARLAAVGADTINLREYCHSVRDLADLRALRSIANDILQSTNPDPSELGSLAVDAVDSIVAARSTQDSPSLSLGASVARAIDAAALAYQSDGKLLGMPYGLRDVDDKTLGLHRGELTLMAGRPGSGKSMLALTTAKNLAEDGYKGIFFSLEMSDVSLSQRLISDIIFDKREITYHRIRAGKFSDVEFQLLKDAGDQLRDLSLTIEQQAGISFAQIAAKARRKKQRDGLDFVVIDHGGKIALSDRYRGSKVDEIGELSAAVMNLAKELDVGMLMLWQLNRGVESRDDKRPNMSDLRGAGNLEEDAATIVLLYREAYYLQNKEPRPQTPEHVEWQRKLLDCNNSLEILLEKNRHGPTANIKAFVDVKSNAVRNQDYQPRYR